MKRTTWVAGIAVVVLLALASAVLMGQQMGNGLTSSTNNGGTTSSTGSIQGGNQTYIATYVGSISTPVVYTTTTSGTSQQGTPGGSFTYSPSSQVKVTSVNAVVTNGGSGATLVGFTVQFQNSGNRTIYVLSGGGSSLNSTITSGSSIVNVVTGPRCEIAVAPTPLAPGADRTVVSPGCWSGFSYQLTGSGTIGVNLVLSWTYGIGQTGGGSIDIQAQFTLSQ